MTQIQQQLAAQLKQLQHPSPVLRRQAAFGCFQLLQALPSGDNTLAWDTVLECLSQKHPVSFVMPKKHMTLLCNGL